MGHCESKGNIWQMGAKITSHHLRAPLLHTWMHSLHRLSLVPLSLLSLGISCSCCCQN